MIASALPFPVEINLLGLEFAFEVTSEILWVAFGLLAQFMFMMRFVLQWIATERAKRSIVPIGFWYLSVAGGATLLAYAIHRADPVFIVGQSTGLFIYLRNLYFLRMERRAAVEEAEAAATEAATRIAGRASERAVPAPGRIGFTAALCATIGGLALLTAYRIGALFAADIPLFGDEAQYWTWAKEPAFGYFSKPPMVAWGIAVATALLGESEAAVRLPSAIAYLVGGVFVFLLARRLFDERVGLWSAAVYATLPALFFSSVVSSTDPWLLMFWAIALYGGWRAMETGGMSWWIFTGAAIGLGMMSKYTMIAFPLSFMLYLLATPLERRRGAWPGLTAAIATAAVILAPNILWNAQNGFVSFTHVAANANLGGDIIRPLKLLEFLGGQFLVFGPMLFPVLLFLLFGRLRAAFSAPRTRYLIAFVAPLLAVITLQSLLSRANANWAAPIYVSATILVVAALRGEAKSLRFPAHRLFQVMLPAGIALHAVFGAAMYHYDPIIDALGIERTRKTDPFYNRQRGWDALGRQVSGLLAQYPTARLAMDDRMPLALMMYYAGDRGYAGGKFNPDPHIDDHYDLTRDVKHEVGGDLLLLTRAENPNYLDMFCDASDRVATLTAPMVKDRELRYNAILCRGFLGYR